MQDPKLTFLIRCAYGAVWLALIWLMVRYVLVWLLPFLIALALAALLEPAVVLCRRRLHLRRGFTATVLSLVVLGTVAAGLVLLAMVLLRQVCELSGRLPGYLAALPRWTELVRGRAQQLCAACPEGLRSWLEALLDGLSAQLAELLEKQGVDLVDAPVSGHRERALDGTLTIMCGGRREAFDRVKPLLDCMGSTVLYMGPSGSGQLTKMINNCCLNICAASFCELMPLGVKLGLDPEQLGQVLTTASGSSYASKTLIPEILQGNFDHGFTMGRAYKDMEGISQVCARYQVPLPTLSGAMQTYQLALRHGDGERYKGAMIRFYEDLLGVECRAGAGQDKAEAEPAGKKE